MKRSMRIATFLAIVTLVCSCQNRHVPQNQEKVSRATYQKILRICPAAVRKVLLVYYFDGDCAICLGKASYIEKYANARGLTPVFIAKTLNPAEFQYNLKKLNVLACVHIEENHEFENKIFFMKVMKIDVGRNVWNYDDEIQNNR